MNSHIIRFSLDLDRQDSQVYVNVRKGETAAKLSVSLTASGVPYNIAEGTTAVMKSTPTGGTYNEEACTISEGRIEIELAAAHTQTAGRYHAYFELSGGEAVLPTPSFTVNVDDPSAN